MSKFREFFVGDKVRVVDTPYTECPFTWVSGMTRMCGKIVTIASKNNGSPTYCYTIKEASFNWCGNCFVPLETEEDLPEIEDDSFLKAIRMGGVKLYETDRTPVSDRRLGRSRKKLSSVQS